MNREDFFMEIADNTLKLIIESMQKQIDDLKQQIIKIPMSSEYHANRYDTDDEYVLHFWTSNGQNYDIRIKKDTL